MIARMKGLTINNGFQSILNFFFIGCPLLFCILFIRQMDSCSINTYLPAQNFPPNFQLTESSVEKYKLLLKGEKKELIEEKYQYEKPRECFSKPKNLVIGLYSYNLEEIECITDVYLIDRNSNYETDIDKAKI